MQIASDLPRRKSIRLQNFDYSRVGAYFVTICTRNRQQILSRIVGGDVLDAPKNDVLESSFVELLPCGEIAEKYINQLNDFYDNLSVERYVIMPNHIHILLFVKPKEDDFIKNNEMLSENGASRTSPPTRQHSAVSQFVSTFKRFCNKEYRTNIWQRYYNDHIIRNPKDYEEHINYILLNPARWYCDELYVEE